MTQDMRVALTTSLNDRLAGPLRRSLDEVEKNLKDVQKELGNITQMSQRASRAMANMDGPTRAAREVADLARNTQNSVRLAERLQKAWNTTGGIIGGVTKGAAAWQAAKYVVAPAMQQARSYDRQLADAANTAYADSSVTARKAGMGQLDAIVTNSLRSGGGKREDALEALNDMLASGKVSVSQASTLLPAITRYATAGNASAKDLSSIAVRALQNGFKEGDITQVLDMALVAGQKGGFELKDMARWLPKMLAAGKLSGLDGQQGYARILASAQASAITAGSKDEAGNNLLNLLLKLNSSDTANDAKKLGIDLAGSLAAARAKGVTSLDAFVNLTDQVAGRDPRLVALRKQAAAASNDEDRQASYLAQRDILEGSAIGKIVQDRQALLALVAEMNNRGYVSEVMGAALGAKGQYGAANFSLISGTADFRMQQAANEKLFAQTGALSPLNEGLAKFADGTTSLYQKFPGFASAIEAAKLALTGLAAAAGAAGLVGVLTGRAGGLIKAGGAAATVAGTSGLYAAGGSAPVAASAGVAIAGAVAAPLAVLSVGALASEALNSESGLRSRIKSREARLAELNELASLEQDGGSKASLAKLQAEIAALTADRNNLQQRLQIVLQIDGREISTVVNEQNANAARRD
jgi:hypothetical protein